MSAKQVNLKSPVTIAVVVLLLGVVVVLNVNTFGGGGQDSSRGYRLQAHPPVPMDAARFAICKTELSPSVKSPATKYSSENLLRDPFFPGKAQPNPTAQPKAKRRTKSKATRPKAKPLQCSAIMLGGIKPMAIINGEGRHLGDRIRGMTLASIDADGVLLRKANGSTVHLTVGVQEDQNNSFRVVTRTRKSDDQGRTFLVDQ